MLTDNFLFDIVVIQWTSLNYVSDCFFFTWGPEDVNLGYSFQTEATSSYKGAVCIIYSTSSLPSQLLYLHLYPPPFC